MKNIVFKANPTWVWSVRFVFLLALLIGYRGNLLAQVPESPNPPRLFNDFANLLDANQGAALEDKLLDFNQQTGMQVAVVIVPTMNEITIEDYAEQLFKKWGIGGSAKADNGLLLLVALKERKMRFEVGYGLEGLFPDSRAYEVIDQVLKPAFKQEAYYEGISSALDEVYPIISEGKFQAKPMPEGAKVEKQKVAHKKKKGSVFGTIFQILLVIVVIIVVVKNPWLLLLFMGGRGGGGGGFGDFSGGRGDFGGFGGGRSGGGGASGSW